MLRARRQKIGDKYNKVVVCTATDQTAMESIVSAQQGLRNAHDLVQQVNIAILKMYSILASRAPKVLDSKPVSCSSLVPLRTCRGRKGENDLLTNNASLVLEMSPLCLVGF